MSSQDSPDSAEFDEYAANYDEALAQGIAASGEDKIYFVRRRLEWLKGCLESLAMKPVIAMEYGCGTGSALPYLSDLLAVNSLVAVDVSAKSLEVARSRFGSLSARFFHAHEYDPIGEVDVAVCNGVFHHIPPTQRAVAVDYVYRCLKPGGVFALWENNPWNLGTRYVMSRIPFDRNAITLSPPETQRLLKSRGFSLLRTDFLFIFPRPLAWLRVLEQPLSRLPFGAQYQVLASRPMR